jgi:pyruvate formate lyase activating enzyme
MRNCSLTVQLHTYLCSTAMSDASLTDNAQYEAGTSIQITRPGPKPLTPSERSRLESVEGFISDIQRYSLHDGPGLRTDIFPKGYSLHCGWCANPEAPKMQPELALFLHNCIECEEYEEPCSFFWVEPNGDGLTSEMVSEYRERVAICPTGAIRWIGERRTAGDILAEVLRDTPFYAGGGGITLTGGEATMQPDMCDALLRLAKAEGISTAVETCGHTQYSVFERLLPYLDHILFDVKHLDSELHRAHCGLGNELILSNLKQLVAAGAPLTIRIPLIPGFNATTECVLSIAEFMLEMEGDVGSIDLLPYHSLGRAKYKALGREYPWEGYDRLADKDVETMAAALQPLGFKVSIGGV